MPYALSGSYALYRAVGLVFVCSLMVAGSAVLLVREFFGFREAPVIFLVGTAAIYAGWIWQRIAFLALIPKRFLEYGFFLTDQGKQPRFLVLELPFWTITTILVVGFIASALIARRRGSPWWFGFVLIAWWLGAFLVFAMPSLNLYLQGDAAIFI